MKRLSIHVSPTHKTISFMNRRTNDNEKKRPESGNRSFAWAASADCHPLAVRLRQQIIETVFISRGGRMEFYCLRASCDCFCGERDPLICIHVLLALTRRRRHHGAYLGSVVIQPSTIEECPLAALNARLNVDVSWTLRSASPKKYEKCDHQINQTIAADESSARYSIDRLLCLRRTEYREITRCSLAAICSLIYT